MRAKEKKLLRLLVLSFFLWCSTKMKVFIFVLLLSGSVKTQPHFDDIFKDIDFTEENVTVSTIDEEEEGQPPQQQPFVQERAEKIDEPGSFIFENSIFQTLFSC